MITKQQYVEFLVSTPANYTCSYLANHLEGVSHDTVTDFLQKSRFTARNLWGLAQYMIDDSEISYLIIDDSVQEKRYAKAIELVKRQYSGNAHGIVKGINVVNLVHVSKLNGESHPIDYRIYAPEHDGLTKNDHFREMLEHAFFDKEIKAKKIVFDAWYASKENLKYIHRKQRFFVTTLKSNRLVSLSKDTGYQHLDTIVWTQETLHTGILVKLKEVPFQVRLFKIVATNGDIDWVITNDLDSYLNSQIIQQEHGVGWKIEELHRELKQLTGIEKCQCQQARSQRNHIACCYHAWLSLKAKARELKITLYQARSMLFSEYLRAELQHPHIPAFNPG